MVRKVARMRKPFLRLRHAAWLVLGLLAVAGLRPAIAAEARTPAQCLRLVEVRLPDGEVLTANFHDPGPFKGEDGKPVAAPTIPFCRVTARLSPSPDSVVEVEVWLPVATWNGRLWGVGNGNFAGAISQRALASRMGEGYAAVATDTGHEGKFFDASWAVGHPERVVDFGHRGIHVAAVMMVQVTLVARLPWLDR